MASDADPEADPDVGRREASAVDPAVASDAAQEGARGAGPEAVPDADPEVASAVDPAVASDAAREAVADADPEEVPDDVRADRNGGCRAVVRARRGAVRSRYGQVRCYPGCCRRGNSRTNLQ
ncbi:hypothetical protein CH266_21995 [Rhodococcus sp. 06-1474-1B]|nr:hypothetical protein CH266_21830 [Rhodococcus sp. 06-1474-1B]OZD43987.1 hypothetical protein CH266_21995 [Rhodococcus sp. 06-1474-1B]